MHNGLNDMVGTSLGSGGSWSVGPISTGRINATVTSQVSAPKTRRLLLDRGIWGMQCWPLMCLCLAPSPSLQCHESPAEADCGE